MSRYWDDELYHYKYIDKYRGPSGNWIYVYDEAEKDIIKKDKELYDNSSLEDYKKRSTLEQDLNTIDAAKKQEYDTQNKYSGGYKSLEDADPDYKSRKNGETAVHYLKRKYPKLIKYLEQGKKFADRLAMYSQMNR